MSLAEVIEAHRAEMGKRQRRQPFSDAFGAELFRRALAEGDPRAWQAVVEEYRALVTTWVRRHSAYAVARTDVDDVVVRAFARLWMAVRPERLAAFPDFAGLMRYLKMCVHSVLMDEVKALEETFELPDEEHDIEALAIERLAASHLWGAMMRVLADEAERVVIQASFGLGLKPGAISVKHPVTFCCTADVYRVKRNAIDRLKRSPEIQAFVSAA
jgi:hypothetical protein